MDLTRYQTVAARMLAEIGPPIDHSHITEWEGRKFELHEFPLPSLVLFSLTRLLNLKAEGRGEKIAWSLNATFRDTPFQLAERKGGFQIVVPKGTPDETLARLVKVLRKSVALAIRSLESFAKEQIEAGNVTIPSQLRFFEGSYQFFREQATTRFSDSATDTYALFDPRVREGGYCASAMLNAYFSCFEHLLLLVLPFTNFEPSGGALRAYARKRWQDKLTTAIDITRDEAAKKLRDTLGKVASDFRNPISHGGNDKRDTIFDFHVPGLAYLPAHLDTGRVTIERFVTPITKADFEMLCQTLDECDALLELTTLGAGFKFARVCEHVSFSADFKDQCRRAVRSPEALASFIDHHHFVVDMQVNMDW